MRISIQHTERACSDRKVQFVRERAKFSSPVSQRQRSAVVRHIRPRLPFTPVTHSRLSLDLVSRVAHLEADRRPKGLLCQFYLGYHRICSGVCRPAKRSKEPWFTERITPQTRYPLPTLPSPYTK